MNRIKLSICIPTYNRYSSLLRLLNQLLPQCEGEAVEVIVSDNASDDETSAYCTAFMSTCPQFHYTATTTNIGFSRNITRLVGLSNGAFIWFIGDDDQVNPDAVTTILTMLEKTHYTASLILANFCRINACEDIQASQPEFELTSDLGNISLDYLLATCGIWASSLSTSILNGSFARQQIKEISDGLSDYQAFYLAIRVAAQGQRSVIAAPLVYRRMSGERILQHRFLDPKTYLIDFIEPLSWARNNGLISRATRNNMMMRMYMGIAGFALLRSLLTGGKPIDKEAIIKANCMVPQFWLLIAPMLILPKATIKYTLRLAHGVTRMARKSKHHAVISALLEND